jgi:hypothetical protein
MLKISAATGHDLLFHRKRCRFPERLHPFSRLDLSSLRRV